MATGGSDQPVTGGHEIFYEWRCNKCEENDCIAEAIAYCRNCRECFCVTCLGVHKRFARDHTVLTEADKGEWGKSNITPFVPQEPGLECSEHKGQYVSMYCGHHDDVCCPLCAIFKHGEACKPTMSYIPSVAQGVVSSADFKDFIATNEQLILKIAQMEAEKSDCLAVVSSSREECRMKIAAICQRLIYRIEELQQISITDADTKHDVEEATIQNDIDKCAELKLQLHYIKQQMQPRQPINEPALFVKMKVGQKCHQKCKQSCESLSKSQMKTFEFQEDPGTLRASLPDTVGECIEKKSLDNFIVSYKDQDIINKVGSFKKQGKIEVTGRRGRHLGPQLDTSTPDTDTVHVLRTGFDWNHDASDLKTFEMKEGITVKVYKANLLKAPVDCIVNAANEYLSHGAGVAKAIADAAGRSLVTEGDKIVKNMGKVQVGIAVATTAGDLQFKCVIHTDGPSWSDYRPFRFEDIAKCEKDLYSAIMHSFLEAERSGLRSIALPAISSAIFAVPEEICTYQYARATINYSREAPSSCLREVHFVDIKPNIVAKIQDSFTLIQTDERKPYNIQKYVKMGSPHGVDLGEVYTDTQKPSSLSFGTQNDNQISRSTIRQRSVPHELENATDTQIFKPVHYEERGNFVVNFGPEQRLNVCQGDLFTKKADALMTVEDQIGSGTGAVSKCILKRKNNWIYLNEKKKHFLSSKDVGDVVVTSGFNYDFKKVFHVVFPYEMISEQPVKRKSCLMKAYDRIFKTAVDENVKSLTMTLFGTGTDKPEDVKLSANAFLDCYLVHCNNCATASRPKAIEIFLVCRDEKKFSALCKMFLQTVHDRSSLQTPPRPAKPDMVMEQTEYKTDEEQTSTDEMCVICMDKVTNPKTLSCGHVFCTECIEMQMKYKPSCPTCSRVFGVITGDQPEGSIHSYTDQYKSCAGYEDYGSISITYRFLPGRQGDNHPNPGKWYEGISRTAFLPDNEEGNIVHEMLKIAFKRKLVFTIGSSRTTGQEGVITWNDIHHKTNPNPGGKFGYPDAEYLTRVKDELAAKGVTKEDIQKETLRDIQRRFRSHPRVY